MTIHKWPWVALILTLLMLITSSSAWCTLCHKEGLTGFLESQRRGNVFLSQSTNKINESSIYIEMTDRGPWYQSNLVADGFHYPTKIGNEPIYNATEAFKYLSASRAWLKQKDRQSGVQNIVRQYGFDHGFVSASAYRDHVHVFVEKNVFKSDGSAKVDLGYANHLTVVDGKAGVILGTVERLDQINSPPLYMAKAAGCCFYGIPPYQAQHLEYRLRQLPFIKKEVAFISLVRDSATERVISESRALSQALAGIKGKGIQSESDLHYAIEFYRGKTLVILGHVEQSNFVVKTASGELLFSAELANLHKLAKQHSTKVLLLGCESAKQAVVEPAGIGVITQFNSVKAAQALEKAIGQSTNYAQFVENLSSPGLKLVANPGFVSIVGPYHVYPKVTLYSKTKQWSSHISQASLSLLGMKLKLPSVNSNYYSNGEKRFKPITLEENELIRKGSRNVICEYLDNCMLPFTQQP